MSRFHVRDVGPCRPDGGASNSVSLRVQAQMTPDIFLSSHAGQFNLHQVYKPGDPYSPARFGEISVYRAKVQAAMNAYQKQLAEERLAQAR